jgi:hypothetical protein
MLNMEFIHDILYKHEYVVCSGTIFNGHATGSDGLEVPAYIRPVFQAYIREYLQNMALYGTAPPF